MCGNDKELFKVVNSLLGKNERVLPATSSMYTLCNQFSKFFFDKVKIIRDEFNDCPQDANETGSSSDSFKCHNFQLLSEFTMISAHDIAKIVRSCNKKV